MNSILLNKPTDTRNNRIDWIDVCKAFAIFFIFFGHWSTKSGNLSVFAYSFDLQFFFILSGFFAINHQKKKIIQFIKHQIHILLIPFIFFTILNIVYFNIDGKEKFSEILLNFSTNFTDFSHSVSSELWFLPALLCVTVFYFFLLKLIKKPIVILVIAYLLYIIQTCYKDTFLGIILYPFIGFIGISSISTYLFWYSLGSFLFTYIKKIVDIVDGSPSIKKYRFVTVGVFSVLITILIYFLKPDAFWGKLLLITHSNKIFNNIFVLTNFKIIITVIICFSFICLSYVFRSSKFLLEIGKNTLILVGFEFIIKNFLALNLIPMLNLGIIKLESTIQVITISFLMVLCVKPLFKPLNKHIPYLLGK